MSTFVTVKEKNTSPLSKNGEYYIISLAKIWRSPRAIYLSELEKHIDEKSPCFSCIGKTDCYGKNKRCLVDVFLRYGNNITFPDPSCINSI